MAHAIHRVTAIEQIGSHSLRLTFEDGTVQAIDFSAVLAGELYGPLSDPAVFRQVRLDPESHTIVWPNGADFDPAQLHDWPKVSEAFARLAQTWSAAHA